MFYLLAAMPKAFGIQGSKGHFPHFFNKRANWDYKGVLPDAPDYGTAQMKTPQREAFFKWYAEQQAAGAQFDLQRDLVKYCEMDVEILMQAGMKFRRMLLDLFEVDPFVSAVTIPGTCMTIYRKRFLDPETIGIVPHQGYRRNDQQSAIAIKWIKWLSETQQLDIQHARNGGEVWIPVGNNRHVKPDGQLRTDDKQLYEFYGCVSSLVVYIF